MSITVQEICKKLLSVLKDSNIVGISIFNDEDRNNFYNYLQRIEKQIKTPENREKRSLIKR
jgi:L-rhamnose mutarotase